MEAKESNEPGGSKEVQDNSPPVADSHTRIGVLFGNNGCEEIKKFKELFEQQKFFSYESSKENPLTQMVGDHTTHLIAVVNINEGDWKNQLIAVDKKFGDAKKTQKLLLLLAEEAVINCVRNEHTEGTLQSWNVLAPSSKLDRAEFTSEVIKQLQHWLEIETVRKELAKDRKAIFMRGSTDFVLDRRLLKYRMKSTDLIESKLNSDNRQHNNGALLLVAEHFFNPQQKSSADVDKGNLLDVMRHLNYEPEEKSFESERILEKELDDFFGKGFEASLIFVLASVGTENNIKIDNQTVKVDKLLSCIRKAKKAENTPRLVVLLLRSTSYREVQKSREAKPNGTDTSNSSYPEGIELPPTPLHHPQSGLAILHAVANFQSDAESPLGSRFILALCAICYKFADSIFIESMITPISHIMKNSFKDDFKEFEHENARQLKCDLPHAILQTTQPWCLTKSPGGSDRANWSDGSGQSKSSTGTQHRRVAVILSKKLDDEVTNLHTYLEVLGFQVSAEICNTDNEDEVLQNSLVKSVTKSEQHTVLLIKGAIKTKNLDGFPHHVELNSEWSLTSQCQMSGCPELNSSNDSILIERLTTVMKGKNPKKCICGILFCKNLNESFEQKCHICIGGCKKRHSARVCKKCRACKECHVLCSHDNAYGYFDSDEGEWRNANGDRKDTPDASIQPPDNLWYFNTTSNDTSIMKYPVEHDGKLQALIINNFCFFNNDDRQGSQKDWKRLLRVLEDCGFRVSLRSNLTGTEMEKEVQNFTEDDHGGMCVLVVMSHGGLGSVSGSDDKEVKEKVLLNLLNGSQTLKDKLKFVIFQVCRDTGNQESDNSDNHNTLSLGEHTIVAHATVPEEYSYRGYNGTRFITSLCHTFHNFGDKEDIVCMVHRINKKMVKENKKGHLQLTSWLIKTDKIACLPKISQQEPETETQQEPETETQQEPETATQQEPETATQQEPETGIQARANSRPNSRGRLHDLLCCTARSASE